MSTTQEDTMTTTTQAPQDYRRKSAQAAHDAIHTQLLRLQARQRAVKSHRGDWWDGYRDALEGMVSDMRDDLAAHQERIKALPLSPVEVQGAQVKWGWIKTHDGRYVSEDGRLTANLRQASHGQDRHYEIRSISDQGLVGATATLAEAQRRYLK